MRLYRARGQLWAQLLRRALLPASGKTRPNAVHPMRARHRLGNRLLPQELRQQAGLQQQQDAAPTQRDGGLYRRTLVAGMDTAAMPSTRRPTYCGVCSVWITGLSTHEQRCKSHALKLAIIKANNNLRRGQLSAATISVSHDKTTAQAR